MSSALDERTVQHPCSDILNRDVQVLLSVGSHTPCPVGGKVPCEHLIIVIHQHGTDVEVGCNYVRNIRTLLSKLECGLIAGTAQSVEKLATYADGVIDDVLLQNRLDRMSARRRGFIEDQNQGRVCECHTVLPKYAIWSNSLRIILANCLMPASPTTGASW